MTSRPGSATGPIRWRGACGPGESDTIEVLIPDLNNPLFPPIVRGIEDRLAEHGYVALLGNTDADLVKERHVFGQLRARHVDGFVLGTSTPGSPILAEAAAADVPVVLINRTPGDYPFSSVSVDDEQGVRSAVAHLAALGHTRIGHIAGPQDGSTGSGRLRGFQAGMAACHLPLSENQVDGAAACSLEEGVRCGRALLAARPDLTAVIAASDMLAVGCYTALDDLGLRCPQDVSVAGFNDMPFVDRLRPPHGPRVPGSRTTSIGTPRRPPCWWSGSRPPAPR